LLGTAERCDRSIGIIAVLMGLLLPALNKARRQSRTTHCLANIRQLGVGFTSYANFENKGRAFLNYANLTAAAADEAHWMFRVSPYVQRLELVSICPETPVRGDPFFGFYAGSTWTFWELEARHAAYALNGWLYKLTGADDILVGPFFNLGKPPDYITLPARGTDRIPIFVDGAWEDVWPEHTDPPGNLRGTNGGLGQPHMSRICLKRHGMAVNAVFLDGHAETLPLPELWKLTWSTKFKPRTVTVTDPG
jgi:prepilin-type processing-associated H-X9-DG protein